MCRSPAGSLGLGFLARRRRRTLSRVFPACPRSLSDPELRHRNARVGHATPRPQDVEFLACSARPGCGRRFDATATWTGTLSAARTDSGACFIPARVSSPRSAANVESVRVGPAPTSRLGEAARPCAPRRSGLVRNARDLSSPRRPARSVGLCRSLRRGLAHADYRADQSGTDFGRGVIGHAVSADLRTWHARPPLSEPQSGFAHLEVPQIIKVEGRQFLIFCCNSPGWPTNEPAAPAASGPRRPGSLGPFDFPRRIFCRPSATMPGGLYRIAAGNGCS